MPEQISDAMKASMIRAIDENHLEGKNVQLVEVEDVVMQSAEEAVSITSEDSLETESDIILPGMCYVEEEVAE